MEFSKKLSIFGDYLMYSDKEFSGPKFEAGISLLKALSGPLMIVWTITRRCNLNCLHCFNNSGCKDCKKDELTHAEAMMVVEQIKKIHPYNVCLCGGEPFIREDLMDIIRGLASSGTLVSMSTNGMLLNQAKARELADAGFSFLQVSIDGYKAETHDHLRNKFGCFALAVQAAKNAVDEGISLAIAFTPTRISIPEFPEAADFFVSIGAKLVRLQPIMPMGRTLENLENLIPSSEDYLQLIKMINSKQAEYQKRGITFEWGDPLEHIYSFGFLKLPCTSIDIRENGALGLSPYIPVRFGNIREHTLQEFWDGGLNNMWSHPIIIEKAKQLLTLDGMKRLSPKPYFEPDLNLDLFEELSKI